MLIVGTGLSGLIGSRIVELLSQRYEFVDFSLDRGVDITQKELLKKALRRYSQPLAVLHLAAFTDVDAAWKQRGNKKGACYQVNVIGTRNIAQICAKKGFYLIHFSTDFVFDGKKKEFYTENDEPHPIEWYGETKYLAELEVKRSGCPYVILRIAFPFKAKSAPLNLEPNPKLDLVRKIMEKLKNGEEIFMFTDQIITPTFIDDIAKVVNKVIEKKPKGIFHCVGSTSLSPYNLALKIAKIFHLPKDKIKKASLEEYLKNPQNRPRQRFLPLSNQKLKKKLNIYPLSLEEALREVKRQR